MFKIDVPFNFFIKRRIIIHELTDNNQIVSIIDRELFAKFYYETKQEVKTFMDSLAPDVNLIAIFYSLKS
jgi:hypothetical protein